MTTQRWWPALALALLVALLAVGAAIPAKAANASDFDPGYIISDEQFYDYNSMSAAEIQSFLDGKVARCKTELSKGPDDPIVCIEDYRATTQTLPADAFCAGTYEGASNELASTIIYKVAQACRINPKVLIVTLQKEQGLITHTYPSDFRYQKAMGFACPDTAPCDTEYFGFQNQVWRAARQFQRYKANPGNYNYRAGLINNIYYYPPNSRPDCGTGEVFIRNVATASLYNYTPYQPDWAALNALYDEGGWCSSYGNRNFWRDYTDWFGDPVTGVPSGVTLKRIGGADRYESAALMSAGKFKNSVDTIYVATGTNFPDALSAAPAAALARGPLLLVEPQRVPAATMAEITRLKPQTIVVVGGPGAVADSVLATLSTLAPTVYRIDGVDRYEVSRALVRDAFDAAPIAYMATGANFPDALSASAAAGSMGAPIILVPGTQGSVDDATSKLLRDLGVTEVRIVGGTGVVSTGIESGVKALPFITKVTRLGGADRYVVSTAVNSAAFTSSDRVYLASGLDFPDALAGAVLAGINDAPLYVIPPTCIPRDVATAISTLGATKVTLLGGTGALGPGVSSYKRC